MKNRNDYDSPWKDILDVYFPEFMAFFFPDANHAIDWQKGFRFLDKELTKILKTAAQGKRFVDKLVQLTLKDGARGAILVHIEIQGDRSVDFAKRMFVYNYRLFDRYDCPVASLAVLADVHKDWRPDSFGYSLLGCRHSFRFPVIKLRDHGKDWRALEAQANPFAIITMAHLKAKETTTDLQARLQWKLYLIRHLYQRGYNKQKIRQLFRFIDWVLTLPEKMERKLKHTLEKEEIVASYVTSWERIAVKDAKKQGIAQGLEQGAERGLEQGVRKGAGQAFLIALGQKFGPPPEWVKEKVAEADQETIAAWIKKLFSADTVEHIFSA